MNWPSTYLGFDVLPVEPNRNRSIQETLDRAFAELKNDTGSWTHDDFGPAPQPGRPFVWTCFGAEEIAGLFSWLDARKGRRVPFWLPSWQADLELSADVLQGDTLLPIRWIRYTTHLFLETGARRHLVLLSPSLDPSLHRISEAADPGDGLTESLTLDPALPAGQAASTTLISFLKLCRLDDDLTKISWPSRDVAEALINCRELPNEAPL